MSTFALKLVLTPRLIAVATLAGRRWGPGVGGWVTGLPLTSGPVSVFLALEQGPEFAARAATGTLLGLVSVATFCVGYSASARHATWGVSAAAGVGAFVAATAILGQLSVSIAPACALVCALLGVAAVAIPVSGPHRPRVPAPPWDLPVRMGVATGMVLLLTAAAQALGPALTGLLTPFPVFALVLSVFAHRVQGGQVAARLLRGVVVGSFAFAAFFLVVGTGLPRWGLVGTYGAAVASALAVNVLTLAIARRWL
jgi:hypothetical protein